MAFFACLTHIHNVNDLLSHKCFICCLIGISKFLLDKVKGKEQGALLQKFIVLGFVACFTDDVFCSKQLTALMDNATV